MTFIGAPFSLGVNYWPRRKAMTWWQNFDKGEVRDDFALLHEIGMDTVRLFLMWQDFQPQPDQIAAHSLANLVTVADLAAEAGLSLNITFFTGHMSGPNWSPAWMYGQHLSNPSSEARPLIHQGQMASGGYLNMYTDPMVIAASELLVRTVVQTLKDHRAVGIWNLGNEPDLFAQPSTDEVGCQWTQRMVALIHDIDPHHPVTLGLRYESLTTNNGFRVDQIFGETDLAVMHAYPMYVDLARSPLDPDLVPFTCALTTALCGKPTLMEEFGGCMTPPGMHSSLWEWQAGGRSFAQFMASEEDFASYIAQVLPRLVEVGASGAVLWCFADYIPELWDQPPCDVYRHERSFGLVRSDGSLKPHAQIIKEFAATHPVIQQATRRVDLAMTPDEFYISPQQHMQSLYQHFTASDTR